VRGNVLLAISFCLLIKLNDEHQLTTCDLKGTLKLQDSKVVNR